MLAAYARLANIGTVVAALRPPVRALRHAAARACSGSSSTDPLPKGLDVAARLRPPNPEPRPATGVAPSTRPSWRSRSTPPTRRRSRSSTCKDACPIVHAAPTDATRAARRRRRGHRRRGRRRPARRSFVGARDRGARPRRRCAPSCAQGADLVLTDSNRRRNQQFFAGVRDNSGYTERAGQDSSDRRVPARPLPAVGGRRRQDRRRAARRHGRRHRLRHAERPAVEGGRRRPEHRVAGRRERRRRSAHHHHRRPPADDRPRHPRPVAGQPDRPVDHAGDADVRPGRFGDRRRSTRRPPPPRARPSRSRPGPRRGSRSRSTGVDRPFPKSLNPIGFTEIGFGDTRVTETVRLPVTLAKDLGRAADGHRLDVVLSRLRNDPSRRLDEELTLDRRFVLPDARSFLLSGTARIEPNAPDPVIDSAMGTTAPGTQYTSSSHLMGDADARASRAFDHDPKTAWTEEVGNPGACMARRVDADRTHRRPAAAHHGRRPTSTRSRPRSRSSPTVNRCGRSPSRT